MLEDAIGGNRKNTMPTKPATSKVTEIKLAHSPDSDDAFMFYGLATQKVRTPGLKFSHVLADIETLNKAAQQEIYDVTAFSFGAYPYFRDKYVLLDCGASFGEGYGPIVVSQHPLKPEDLPKCRIGVPGLQTSAYLALRLYEPRVEPVVMAFDHILDAVKNSVVDAGLLIHEGQLYFPQMGMHKVVDLGQWWIEQTGLPLPLGGNAVRRALGPAIGLQVARAIRESVSYALDHREAAVNYAMQFAREMETDMADKFIGMYVNNWTLGYGERGRQAVQEFLKRGVAAGLIPGPPEAEFLLEE
jgi:1,4-dihydroxy-6-naphthoate synthase